MISGDRNDLSIERLKTVDPSLRQIVQHGTRGQNILTVVLTDLEVYYKEPIIVNPIDVDDPTKGGVPSDHNGVVVVPRTETDKPVLRQKVVRTIRPITSSSILNIGQVFTHEEWLFMDPKLSSTQLTELFEYYTGEVLNIHCPQTQVWSRPGDVPFVTEKMKVLKRVILREYEKRGKSEKYWKLKSTFKQNYENEVRKYKEKIIDDVRNGSRNCSYSALHKLGVRPGDSMSNTFHLPSHVENNLSPGQSVELIADHFSAISQDYDPINIDNFPAKMRYDLRHPDMSVVPRLEEYQVYKKICSAKKPNSCIKGDLPKKIVQEFSVELSSPITVIYNSILSTLQYPRQWVVEHQIPLPKSYPPSSEDELRNIAKTAFFSKCFESFLSDWLLPIVGPYLDPCQYGLKGASISHYLIKLLKFIHEYLDLKNPHAVLIALIDLSKAFNRISHQMVIEDLYDMHVPNWLLLILSSYLTERSMILTYNGASSSPRSLPGSSPQGAFLGIFFFVIKYNAASLRPRIPRFIGQSCCKTRRGNCKTVDCSKHSKEMHAVYIDDLTQAVAIELKKEVNNDPQKRPFPLNFHERTKHVLPAINVMQQNLIKLEDFTKDNLMKINEKKSKIMIFNKSKKYDFPPELSFSNKETLECLEDTRLLGIVLSSNLKWNANSEAIYKKSMEKMWLLRRMKLMKLEKELIFDYYKKEIRPLVEHGVVVWNSGLTKAQANDIEKIQKVALRIILGDDYGSYDMACKFFDVVPLSLRRTQLCLNFSVKLFKSERTLEFFTPAVTRNTKNQRVLVKENICRTTRCFKAPHNYLARLVNANMHLIENK